MAYKQPSSPLNNRYASPSAVTANFADSSLDIDFVTTNTNGVQSGSSEEVPTDPDALSNENKKDYPRLQNKLKNAKNVKQRQKFQGKINKKTIKHTGKAEKMDIKQNVKEAEKKNKWVDKVEAQYDKYKPEAEATTYATNPYDETTQKAEYDAFQKQARHEQVLGVLGTKESRIRELAKSPIKMKTPLNYLNPNTLEVQGDAGQSQDPAQQMPDPNRAGRPINSNVLMNDPTVYQDPSKVSAQQNQQQQMFSGLASSAGTPNPEPMIPGQDPNQSITPGQQSPFNKNGEPDKIYQAKDLPQTNSSILPELTVTPNYSSVKLDNMPTNSSVNEWGNEQKQMKMGQRMVEKKMDKRGQRMVEKKITKKPAYRLSQSINKTTGDTTSYEMIPGPKEWVNDDTFGKVQMSTLTPNPISNEEYRKRMNDPKSPLKKTGWIQEATADIKRRGTEGVCTGDKFGGPSCPPGSKRYNLAKTFKKMAKKR